MSGQQTTSSEDEAPAKGDMSLEQKIGMAKKFDREMKDYAKATVKEFLGIYGYEEDVDINMDESEAQKDAPTNADESKSRADNPETSESSTPRASTMTSTSDVGKGTGNDRPVSSVSISSSTTNASSEDPGQFEKARHEDVPGLSMFSWDEYLAKTKGVAAPWTCFKQAATPPFNGFQCGMKLEAADPRKEGSVCVATVVGVIGSRLRLRFDGCDNSNDIWRVIDSGDIHPVGWCEGNGGVLQPPVGFHPDIKYFSSFLQKTLANGELAPLRLFKKEPNTPKVNLFCPTFKVEAVDLKNPALICVGTVLDVIGDDVMIAFDGWKETAYTYPYYSRDIFPPGWCYFSGHPLQPPGPEYTKFKSSSSKNDPSAVKPLDGNDSPVQSTKQKLSLATPDIENADSASGEATIDLAFTIPMPVELFVNHACDFGSYLDPFKVAELRPLYRGNVREVLQTSIQAIVNAAYNPSIVIGFLRPGRGKIVIKAKHGQDTYTCCLQSVDHIWVFWNVFGRFTDNLRCCKNLFSSERLEGVCSKCQNEGAQRLKEERRMVEEEERRLNETRNKTPLRGEPAAKTRKIVTEDQEDVGSTSSPLTWSVDEVVEHFKRSDISKYAEMFRQHEIDGGALLLLNRETIMSCMQFKLGPALKLLNHINELKSKFSL